MERCTVEPGQRYRDVRTGIYGRLADSDWIVEAVKIDAQGIRHARLVSVADPTVRKTLAAEVLVDPARFGSAGNAMLAASIRTGNRFASIAVPVIALVAIGWTGDRWLASLGDSWTGETRTALNQPASMQSAAPPIAPAAQPAPAADEPPFPAEVKPLMAPSPEPPIQKASAPDLAKLKYGEFRRHRVNSYHPALTVNGGETRTGNHGDEYALPDQIYHPGSRPPGW